MSAFEAHISEAKFKRAYLGRKLRQGLSIVLLISFFVPGLLTLGDTEISLSLLIVSAAIIILSLYPSTLNPKFKYNSSRQAFLIASSFLFIMTVLSLLSIFYADSILRTFRYTFSTITGIVTLFVFISVSRDEIFFLKILKLFVMMASVSSIFSLMSNTTGLLSDLIYQGTDRAHGFFKHPNQFAMILSMAAPVSLALALHERNKILWVSNFLFICLGLALAGSKSNLIISALCMSSIVALWGIKTNAIRKQSILFTVMFAAFVALSVFAGPILQALNPRAYSLLLDVLSGETIASVDHRFIVWEKSLNDGLENPFSGVGAGQLVFENSMTHSHNAVLDFFRTLGVPGLFLGILLYVGVAMYYFKILITGQTRSGLSRKNQTLVDSLSMAGLAYLVANLSSDSFGPSTSPLFWFVFAVSLGMIESRKAKYVLGANYAA